MTFNNAFTPENDFYDKSLQIQEQNKPAALSNSSLSTQDNFGSPSNGPRSIIVSWQNEFSGGPDIVVHTPDGRQRPAQKRGYRRQTDTISNTSDSRSVLSVYDLGLNNAPKWFRNALESKRNRPVLHEAEKSVREEIEDSLQLSQLDPQQQLLYLPLDTFEAIFSRDTIVSVICQKFPKTQGRKLRRKIDQIVGKPTNRNNTTIQRGRRRIFGILVFIGALHYVDDFIREGIFDDDLPLRPTDIVTKAFRTRAGSGRADIKNTTLMRNWSRTEVDLFYINQRRFFVPFFESRRGELLSHVFDTNVTLPWQHYKRKTNGGNGVVYQLCIHPSHHNFQGSQSPDQPLYFAVKEIDSLNRETYREEIRALEKANAKVHKEKHLIHLLLTFQHGDKLYLLFEWADGNLADFWRSNQFKLTPSLTSWVAQQCLGIATAIKRIHGLATWQKDQRSSASSVHSDTERDWGRHGDIKPNNILWFSKHGQDRNLLVVSDLGLTRYHSRLTKSLVSHLDGYTGSYRAPESAEGLPISQKYDIWSLGCVFLEFCVWYLLGSEAVDRFEGDRQDQDKSDIVSLAEDRFFTMVRDETSGARHAQLNTAVEEWIERLCALETGTDFSRRMLRLIKTQMLDISPERRSAIDVICIELSAISKALPQLASVPRVPSNTSTGPQAGPILEVELAEERTRFAVERTDPLVRYTEGGSGDGGEKVWPPADEFMGFQSGVE